MRVFHLNSIELHIPQECLTDTLIMAIEQERYENQEADALARHLVEGDVVLDLGAGAGYLSSIAAMFVTGKNVVSVEACEKMIVRCGRIWTETTPRTPRFCTGRWWQMATPKTG